MFKAGKYYTDEGRLAELSQAVESVYECLYYTLSVTSALILLTKHKRLIGGEFDWSFMTQVMLQLVLTYIRWVLVTESDNVGDEHVGNSDKPCLNTKEKRAEEKLLRERKVREGYPLLHIFLLHVQYHLNTYLG